VFTSSSHYKACFLASNQYHIYVYDEVKIFQPHFSYPIRCPHTHTYRSLTLPPPLCYIPPMNTQMLQFEDHLKSLAMAVARNKVGANDPISTVLLRENISPTDFAAFEKDGVFQRYVLAFTKELEENGFSFAAKCRVLAEDAIQSMYLMAKDDETPAAARVKAVENLVEWSGLAAKSKVDAASNAAPGFHITFNIPTPQAEKTITLDATDATPTFSVSFTPTDQAPTPVTVEAEYVQTSVLPLDEIMADIGYDAEE